MQFPETRQLSHYFANHSQTEANFMWKDPRFKKSQLCDSNFTAKLAFLTFNVITVSLINAALC